MNDEIETKIIQQIESQASHIMRMYENEELEDKMIELAREWFFKGVNWGIQHKNETKQLE
ncbi:MAG: hypothetical protein K2X39_04430 [Silvanigrellaceae bacterium]|nr:hypothetical protein [Silvanigrellaceae bacterium]